MLEDDRVALAFIDIGHAAAIDLEKYLFRVGLSTDCHDVQLLYEYALQFGEWSTLGATAHQPAAPRYPQSAAVRDHSAHPVRNPRYGRQTSSSQSSQLRLTADTCQAILSRLDFAPRPLNRQLPSGHRKARCTRDGAPASFVAACFCSLHEIFIARCNLGSIQVEVTNVPGVLLTVSL